jgi:hypothetical protein
MALHDGSVLSGAGAGNRFAVGDRGMRSLLLLLAVLPLLGGCATHGSLRDNTVRTVATLTDLNYQMVLDNVAMIIAHPSAMPSFAVINAGTVTVMDVKSVSANATYAPTLAFAQQQGAGLPILSLLFNPSSARNVTENWSLAPVTDMDNLRRIRCAFQLVVLGRETTDCDSCLDSLKRFYLGETERMDCVLPTGWFHAGCKKDVPRDACYVAHYCDAYVWVTPDGLEGLTRFTMTVIDLATGKPHPPMKTVVSTYKADGSLESKQVTTTEMDTEALERLRKQGLGAERQRSVYPPVVNPGLFFVPR